MFRCKIQVRCRRWKKNRQRKTKKKEICQMVKTWVKWILLTFSDIVCMSKYYVCVFVSVPQLKLLGSLCVGWEGSTLLPLWNFCISWFLMICGFLLFLTRESVLYWFVLFFLFVLVYGPNKNCLSCSNNKIIWNLAYLGVIMMSLVSKQNRQECCLSQCIKTAYLVQRCQMVRKVANLCVRKLCKS